MVKLADRRGDETGAVLLIVLFFVLGIGLGLAALIGLAGSSLIATGQIRSERNIEYAADTAADGAIQSVRNVPSTVPPSCSNFPPSGSLIVNQRNVVATCSMGVNPGERIVNFAVCYVPQSGSLTYSTCLPNALLVATVEYTDTGCTNVDSGCSQYGAGMTITSWLINRANE